MTQPNDVVAHIVQVSFAKAMFEMHVDTYVGATLVSAMQDALEKEITRLKEAGLLSDGTRVQNEEPKAD